MTGQVGTPAVGRPRRPRFVVLVTAVRAALAFGIGAVLLLTPDQGTAAIAGFMGVYWLVSGLFSLAWARRGPFLAILWPFMSGSILAFDALRAHRRWSTPPGPDA